MQKSKKIYLDYAATTPVSSGARRVMQKYFSSLYGNSESLHAFGQEASGILDLSRERVAKILDAQFREIIFTSSATEANNILVQGVIAAAIRLFPQKKLNIVLSSFEHASIRTCVEHFVQKGKIEARFITPDPTGYIEPMHIRDVLDENTILVSVLFAQNEVGRIQAIEKIAEQVRVFRGSNSFPVFHTDAVQAFQFLSCASKKLGVDALTLSSHKVYGPKGGGVLYLRTGTPCDPILFGGAQEFLFHPGTVNIPAVVGMTYALEEAERVRFQSGKKLFKIKKQLFTALKKIDKTIVVNGILESTQNFSQTVPHILNIFFPGIRAEELLIFFDRAGIAVSTGSACSARGTAISRTIREITHNEERAQQSIRFSFGATTTSKEIQEVARIFQMYHKKKPSHFFV